MPGFLSDVITLNVGGSVHTTSLTTLRKSPGSMLAAMFSGRHAFSFDNEGRYFIDRDGNLFHHILNYLRQGLLPPLHNCMQVYHEAQFYNIADMCTALELLRPIAGEKIRRKFIQQIPSYDSNLSSLIEKAQLSAYNQPERVSKLNVCIFKEDHHSVSHETNSPSISQKDESDHKHSCDVDMMFGPWRGLPGVYDVIDCIKYDLSLRGYEPEYQCIGVCDQHVTGPHYCKRPIFEFKFKWW